MQPKHVEALMSRKDGSAAANNVRKTLRVLFNHAIRYHGFKGPNPASLAERCKTNPDGYHTWTEDEIDRFLAVHGEGTKARLVMLLAVNTGMARADLARLGRQHVKGGRIAYRRGKNGEDADMPIMPELAVELVRVPTDRLLLITHGEDAKPYKPETLGNWFRDRCKEAGVPGALHGLRKAGAVRLAEAGATENEVMAYLADRSPTVAATYTKKASRRRMADHGFAKLSGTNVSNLSERLDKRTGESHE